MSEFFDLGDAARLLGVDFEGIRRLIDAGELPAIPHRHGVTVPKDSVIEYLRKSQGDNRGH